MPQRPRPFEIVDKDALRYVRRLVAFLGPEAVEKSLRNYKKALTAAGPIYRDYHVRGRHPWWEPLRKIMELDAAGKCVWRHIHTPAEKLFIGDAYKVSRLHPGMPDSVRNKFKRDLMDDNNAWNYIFELQMAGHFYQRGNEIVWYEDDGQPRPEFKVVTGDFEFDVECKRISVDASRKIRRSDFYRLAEKLVHSIKDLGLAGTLDIALNDRLHSSERHLNQLCNDIISHLKAQGSGGQFVLPFGELSLDLKPLTGERHEWAAIYKEMAARKGEAGHGVILAQGTDTIAINPIGMTLISKKSESVLKGIRDVVKDAAVRQFDKTRPGLIVCHLEGMEDLAPLASDSGLQFMSCALLDRPDFSHIAGISYCSDSRFERCYNGSTFSNQALIFRNPKCIFEGVEGYRFVSEDLSDD